MTYLLGWELGQTYIFQSSFTAGHVPWLPGYASPDGDAPHLNADLASPRLSSSFPKKGQFPVLDLCDQTWGQRVTFSSFLLMQK